MSLYMVKRIYPKRYKRRKYGGKKIVKSLSTFRKSNQSQIYKLHVVCWQPIANTTGAPTSLAVSYMFNYPGFHQNNGGSYGPIDYTAPILDNAMLFFHEYRVVSMKVRFEPNKVDIDTTGVDIPNIIYMDPDYTEYALLNDSHALNAGLIPKSFASGKPVSRSMKNRTNTKGLWLKTADLSTDPNAAVGFNRDTAQSNSFGSMRCLWSNVVQDTNIGRMYIEYNIIFRGVAQDQSEF